MKPLYLIDNSNFCYKFKSVHKYARKEVSGVSVDTSVLVGYIRALKANIFDTIYIVLDGVPMQSLKLLPSYKGQRSHDAEEALGIPKLEVIKFLTKIGEKLGKTIKVVMAPGQEADQVMSSITHLVLNKLPKNYKFKSALNQVPVTEDRVLKYLAEACTAPCDVSGYDQVVLGTTDSDLTQLCRYSNVCVDTSSSGKSIMGISPKATAHMNFAAIPIYKAVFGDVSDNVPALSLPINKDAVMSWIASIDSEGKYNNTVQEIMLGVSDNPIIKTICRNCKQEFERNFAIVNLEFYSIPLVLEFPEYNIETTIKKYSLKI